MSFRKSLQAVHYVRDLCLPRLAPLWLLTNRGLGASIPVLRMFYISVIRSFIDYAAPVLIQFSATQLRPLELVQNEAIRIILGCPRTARIEVLRAELHLPRINDPLYHDPRTPTTPYLRKILGILTSVVDRAMMQTEGSDTACINPVYKARNVNCIRQKPRPVEPNSLDFELMDDHILKEFLQKDILDDAHHLVFATAEQLTLLKNART
ncbi:hypothetical protein E2C01_073584 [Portunus trituberculatus]|uniref:Uncharacterized protein n=1 Tax=Portunus trituberculatus TaxID=210409 RepID=A0A5B7I5Q6_PORTR|nr:hypothetical protein [Portunus trituberculatus]